MSSVVTRDEFDALLSIVGRLISEVKCHSHDTDDNSQIYGPDIYAELCKLEAELTTLQETSHAE